MRFEPMINVKLQKFKKDFGFSQYEETKIFELFVNNTILSMHQPDCVYKRPELLSFCSVGGAMIWALMAWLSKLMAILLHLLNRSMIL